jgi:hypothetical protein
MCFPRGDFQSELYHRSLPNIVCVFDDISNGFSLDHGLTGTWPIPSSQRCSHRGYTIDPPQWKARGWYGSIEGKNLDFREFSLRIWRSYSIKGTFPPSQHAIHGGLTVSAREGVHIPCREVFDHDTLSRENFQPGGCLPEKAPFGTRITIEE